MRTLANIMEMAALALALAACGTADVLTAPARVNRDEAGGGTYGSGGRLNQTPSDDGIAFSVQDGGGLYGSGGTAAESGGTYGSGGITATSTTCEERAGGTYGSGGRTEECTITVPTP